MQKLFFILITLFRSYAVAEEFHRGLKFSVVLLLLLFCAICEGQTSFKGLQPGRSTRQDVSGAIGAPVREVSETLSEYRVSDTPGKIYVQYRKASTTIERIEVLPAAPVGRSEILRLLDLRDAASSSKTNAKGKLEEYFDSGKCVVLLHVSSDPGSTVERIGYYSRELFEEAAGNISNDQTEKETQVKPKGPTVPVTQPARIHKLTISDLQVKENPETFELVFRYFDEVGDIDPDKARVIVLIQIVCAGDAGIAITWSAMNVKKLDSQNGEVAVSLPVHLFPSGQGKYCDVGLTLQDEARNASNELKTRVNFGE